ncbi:MAG TPA: malto-oligosyltrehalose synthase [Pedobacter sp.]|nr:malto-oligosyltrehalose synthase [Pedobacter sp.]
MLNPISTYRVQFNKEFTFKDFLPVVSYLHELGIKTIYASPVYRAVPGSTHGYDVTDPNMINPEIGTLEELRKLSALLKSYNMFWVQDIVPNHMGFHRDNLWLMDVLKNGEASPYRQYFDLQTTDLSKEPLMVPFLGRDLPTVIANSELKISTLNGEKYLKYFDSYWPVNQTSETEKRETITEVATSQYYRLCSYKETNGNINYRRFFTVNSLICINMQIQRVFDDYHQLTKSLLEEGIFQGLRIDHIDGLADPSTYLNQLRALCGRDTYIVIEKILEPGEQLPRSWPVQGTTGYDYLGLVNQLFTNEKAERKFDTFYKDLSKVRKPVQEQIFKRKRAFLMQYMQGELDNLCRLMDELKLTEKILEPGSSESAPSSVPVFRELIGELLVRLPVYRLYSNHYPLSAQDFEVLDTIFSDLEADKKYPAALPAFRDIVIGRRAGQGNNEPAIIFFRRLMQFTGPLMAKGVEDTLMYTYNRFIGNNEVGDSPGLFGISTDEFHDQISVRAKYWPYALNASATHDTKRGEDARNRLAVLTDLGSEWPKHVSDWTEMNKGIKSAGAPDANDEYFIYQTLIATCPEQGISEENYEQRLLEYIEKALRESKRNTTWDEPDLDYEGRTKDFIQHLLDPSRQFWLQFSKLLEKVSEFGKLTSISALVLKHTLPGIPDTYQGTELWDLSMVDPDNRRPVDYQFLSESLSRFSDSDPYLCKDMFAVPHETDFKIRLLRILLQLRNQYTDLFSFGNYTPLKVKGKYAANVIAFARQYKGEWLLVVATLNLASLVASPSLWQDLDWEDTQLVLPGQLAGIITDYKNEVTGTSLTHQAIDPEGKGILQVSTLFKGLPLSVLTVSLREKSRGAGILMPVSSLPSVYGIGDFGSSANTFLSFLNEAGLKYWQVLPMNPLSADQAYSPYSSTSVMAGNVLLISPEKLAESGLFYSSELKSYQRKIRRQINFPKVTDLKIRFLEKAYKNWKLRVSDISQEEFEQFCEAESGWLYDYALFVLITCLQGNRPWFQWPQKLKVRDRNALNAIREQHALRLEMIRWQQFIFFRQWKAVKWHANNLGIEIIGDLPFYTAHNSADVWTQPKLFALYSNGQVKGVAGVPPDYFNEDGQLWGMPVYNWKVMNRSRYQWWAARIAMNLTSYDRIRLDHFRAFSEYWEVSGNSENAKSGEWKPGPGVEFFKVLQSSIGKLPLIAEDLGEISQDVYQLRDEFGLPGMKVLQFAFGEDVASSMHAPHNFDNTNCIVYTGTHDNNTTRGWYEDEADQDTKVRMGMYAGLKITRHNVTTQMIRLALASTAAIAIIPVQDLLNKPAKGRMNTPASVTGNWSWRLKPQELTPHLKEKISAWLNMYGR